MTADASKTGFLPATTHVYLARSADSLQEAVETTDPAQRFSSAHVAALRAAAAWLAARAKPALGSRRQRNAWVLLADTSEEMASWASYFASGASQRAAAEAGATGAVSEIDATTLLEAADRFLAVVEESLGLVPHPSVLLPEHGRIRDAG
jgi:hypothetical protein